MKDITCTICGPRPHKLPNGINLMGLMALLESAVRESIERGYTRFQTGAAMGIDLWASQLVLKLQGEYPHIKLLLCLPCATQSDAWPKDWKELHEETLAQADELLCLQTTYSPGCMQRRNNHMLAQSSRLIAVHDGKTPGGTLHTISQAKRLNLDIHLIKIKR